MTPTCRPEFLYISYLTVKIYTVFKKRKTRFYEYLLVFFTSIAIFLGTVIGQWQATYTEHRAHSIIAVPDDVRSDARKHAKK